MSQTVESVTLKGETTLCFWLPGCAWSHPGKCIHLDSESEHIRFLHLALCYPNTFLKINNKCYKNWSKEFSTVCDIICFECFYMVIEVLSFKYFH